MDKHEQIDENLSRYFYTLITKTASELVNEEVYSVIYKRIWKRMAPARKSGYIKLEIHDAP